MRDKRYLSTDPERCELAIHLYQNQRSAVDLSTYLPCVMS